MNAIPLFSSKVVAGFPSPADDYVETTLNLHEHVVKHPAATFFVRTQGDSMQGVGIMNGDLLVVDRSIEPQHGMVVIAALDGELVCKLLDTHRGRLLSANDKYPPIIINSHADLMIEGVVTHSLTQHTLI